MEIWSCKYAAVLLFISLSCSDSGVQSTNASGMYQYVGFDRKSLRVIHQGWLGINLQDSMNVSGEWRFNSQQLQQLAGEFQNGVLLLNLNPGFVDNNLLLRGTIQGRTYRGSWSQVGFPGVIAEGTFVAERE